MATDSFDNYRPNSELPQFYKEKWFVQKSSTLNRFKILYKKKILSLIRFGVNNEENEIL